LDLLKSRNILKNCTENGIYELSEKRIISEYYQEWLEIANDPTTHIGENLKINFLTSPEPEYAGKGTYGLVDGTKGFKNYNINWIGWYGTNPNRVDNKKPGIQSNQNKFS
jgi:hypothetical protein